MMLRKDFASSPERYHTVKVEICYFPLKRELFNITLHRTFTKYAIDNRTLSQTDTAQRLPSVIKSSGQLPFT